MRRRAWLAAVLSALCGVFVAAWWTSAGAGAPVRASRPERTPPEPRVVRRDRVTTASPRAAGTAPPRRPLTTPDQAAAILDDLVDTDEPPSVWSDMVSDLGARGRELGAAEVRVAPSRGPDHLWGWTPEREAAHGEASARARVDETLATCPDVELVAVDCERFPCIAMLGQRAGRRPACDRVEGLVLLSSSAPRGGDVGYLTYGAASPAELRTHFQGGRPPDELDVRIEKMLMTRLVPWWKGGAD